VLSLYQPVNVYPARVIGVGNLTEPVVSLGDPMLLVTPPPFWVLPSKALNVTVLATGVGISLGDKPPA
jgi:hypothetical protein